MERLAILPVENLTGNPDLDWMSRAARGALAVELAGSEHLQPMEVGAVTDVSAAKATAALDGYFEIYNGELRWKGVIRDIATSRTVRTIDAAGPIKGGLLPLLNTAARQISTSVRPYPTSNETALREYFQATGARDAQEAASHLDAAIRADPRFAAPYLLEIERLSATGDVAGAKAAVERAKAAATQFPPQDRARLRLLEALLNNDVPGRTSAMAELAKLQPRDADLRKSLAEQYIAQKNYKGAVQVLEEAAKITPTDIAIWNLLGYAYGYGGDVNGAMRSFGQYKQLAPNDANAFDSIGEILFHSGNFGEAEKNFLAAHEKNAAQFAGIELYRAALCRLALGDVARADELFGKYAEFRKQDQGLPIQSAVWKYESGRANEAINAMQQTIAGARSKDLVALAHMQLALWYVDAGERDKARAEAQAAMQSATSAQARSLAITASYFSMPPASPAEWRKRADQLVSNPAQTRVKQELLGAALLFDHHFAEAIMEWRDLYDSSNPAGSLEPAVFLAWSYVQAGQKDEAAKVVRAGIMPPRTPDPGLTSLAVAKYITLRKQFGK